MRFMSIWPRKFGRKHLHPHEDREGPFVHRHLHSDIFHTHFIDVPCDRYECRAFPPHRMHPQPGLADIKKIERSLRERGMR